ncbi:hypothetical protein GGR52DRAFT_585329 [Hypoxylon sp. FL1284]|nr:hypothetical protein GGR52DRAFT_585329 [Hypoxylon sp. FL1284]
MAHVAVIELMPLVGLAALTEPPITRSNLQEVLTFNGQETKDQDQGDNHPDLLKTSQKRLKRDESSSDLYSAKRRKHDVDESTAQATTIDQPAYSAADTVSMPQLHNLGFASLNSKGGGSLEVEDGEDEDTEVEYSNRRTIVIPGHPLQFVRLDHDQRQFVRLDHDQRQFVAPELHGVERPSLAFEDLCRALIEEGKLSMIQSAVIVTDTATLSALFSTLLDKVVSKKYPKKRKGFAFVVQRAGRVTFLKSVSKDAAGDSILTAATRHLKQHGLHSCPKPNNQVFKRAVKYRFGDVNLIVEDGNQVSYSGHACKGLEEEDLGVRDERQ